MLLNVVYTEIDNLRDWLIGALDRVRALEELMESCESLPFEILRQQCRVATEAIQLVNMGLILLELQFRVKITSKTFFSTLQINYL